MRIWLTNAASRRPPHRGPGRVLTIMAAPRPQFGEAGVGEVPALVPPWEWVRAAKAGELPPEEYRARYLSRLAQDAGGLVPGALAAYLVGGRHAVAVADGDTLICACSRAAAAAGRCHRCWAGEALLAAGWDVVLDGREVPRV